MEIGESKDTVETAYSGDPLLMGFNSQYLLDFLKVAGSASVRFEFKNAQTAGELKPEEADPAVYLPICGNADQGLMSRAPEPLRK